jgi:hypothetical protein
MRLLPILLLLSVPAFAWPVDVVQDLEMGKEKFIRLSSLDWFEVEDPKVVAVEYLESGEILFTGLQPGRTLVLMYAEKKFAVWRIKVGGKSQPEGGTLAAALKACPKLAYHPADYDKLVGVVTDEKCRLAVLALLATDTFVGKELDLTFPIEVLQSQLKSISAAFVAQKQKLSARYEGAGLVLTGGTDVPGQRKALWEVFKRSAGRVAMDDQIEVPSPPDAGSRD